MSLAARYAVSPRSTIDLREPGPQLRNLVLLVDERIDQHARVLLVGLLEVAHAREAVAHRHRDHEEIHVGQIGDPLDGRQQIALDDLQIDRVGQRRQEILDVGRAVGIENNGGGFDDALNLVGLLLGGGRQKRNIIRAGAALVDCGSATLAAACITALSADGVGRGPPLVKPPRASRPWVST